MTDNGTISGVGDPEHEARMMQMLFAGAMTAAVQTFAAQSCRDGWTVEQAVNDDGDYLPYCTLTLASGIQLRIRVDVAGHQITED